MHFFSPAPVITAALLREHKRPPTNHVALVQGTLPHLKRAISLENPNRQRYTFMSGRICSRKGFWGSPAMNCKAHNTAIGLADKRHFYITIYILSISAALAWLWAHCALYKRTIADVRASSVYTGCFCARAARTLSISYGRKPYIHRGHAAESEELERDTHSTRIKAERR
jgi:hypothetical protein